MRITYEIITPESAEHGDAEERGFIEPQFGLRVPIEEALDDSLWPAASLEWSVRAAEIRLGRNALTDVGGWFEETDGSTNYRTGAVTRESLHPGKVTASTYTRLKEIFCYD